MPNQKLRLRWLAKTIIVSWEEECNPIVSEVMQAIYFQIKSMTKGID
jgi:hypothetical protein